MPSPSSARASVLARIAPASIFTAPDSDDPVDEAIRAAHKAVAAGNLVAFSAAAANVPRGHVLSDYLDYWALRLQLQASARARASATEAESAWQTLSAQVQQYLRQHAGTLTADLLRRDWMLAAGRVGDWAVIDREFPRWVLKDESAPFCLASQSALSKVRNNARPATPVLKTATQLVLKPERLNATCGALLQTLADRKLLSASQRMRRLHLALEINSPADIRHAVALLDEKPAAKALDLALSKPAQSLKKPASPLLTKIALVRLARLDPAKVAEQLQDNRKLKLSAADRQFVWAQVAALGMQRLDPSALTWTKRALKAGISDNTRVWLARAALAEQAWPLLEQIIRQMDEPLRSTPTWTYWHGRAQQALKHPARASRVFEKLAKRHDYYGKLAREELGQKLSPPLAPTLPADAAIDALGKKKGIRQAMSFYNLGLRSEGNRAWNFQMRSLDEQQLRAAAIWANRHGLLDRAINADERISGAANHAVRFPVPFAEQLLSITSQQRIDPAWVYGLIRQESRFIMQARSHVGASGLMQIMPATASWIARQMGQTDYRQAQLNDLEVNLTFGSYYLKRALDDLDGSPVLASAGYNAGPGRAHAWRARLSRPVEGAIFAEMIPFSETRHYVKAVLSNTVDYAGLFTGEPQSLKTWLSTITPKPRPSVVALP
ncbi:MAG: transglycosylase SLT domain-containing protein [Lautropia sp.]|nr:transglycosylase SLT domain-containing protein [Lautropia sp.]